MGLFSQRKGIKPLKKEFQRETMDDELRNRLWSALRIVVWDKHLKIDSYSLEQRQVETLLDAIWIHYLKLPIDERPSFTPRYSGHTTSYVVLKEYFFNAKWFEVYDFIEFILKYVPEKWREQLRGFANNLLEDENAAYRIIAEEVVEITDETEIEVIEEVLDISIKPISNHFSRALELLADKRAPDYRNSIKESISAVEACCQYITNDPKATLGDALKKFNSSSIIHPALEKGFSSIYGYTSDSGGIRHALTDGGQIPTYADAKFMLVACAGFVNYLLTKIAENQKK